MIIEKQWKILTIGDGDLSFSNALFKQHHPNLLTATIYDSFTTLSDKYSDDFYQQLKKQNIPVFFEFDITNPHSWPSNIKKQFDLVIFQFPLLPAFDSFSDYINCCANTSLNTLNRRLLRHFLINSFNHFLDPNGQQLCYITSKDVNPYRQWNIENSLNIQTDIHYLGTMPFDINMFPGYKIRNVDRDKHVKNTNGMTYIWSKQKKHPITKQLQVVQSPLDNYCKACRAGPFVTETEQKNHKKSKKHLKMMEFERLWLADINKDKLTQITEKNIN